MIKKLLFSVLITFGIPNVQAQEAVTSTRLNDFTLSPIELIEVPLLNISYERLLNESFGFGMNGLFYFGKNSDSDGFTQISPYFRSYFGKKFASGFFVQGFVPITMTKEHYRVYDEAYTESTRKVENRTSVGLGFGFGAKWVSRKNIIFESSIGVAKRFGEAKNYYSTNITGIWMLGIGYRL